MLSVHRLHDAKHVVRVYDYVDSKVPMLARMYAQRLKSYGAIGYRVGAAAAESELPLTSIASVFHHLWARRVENQILVSRGRLVLAQVNKDGHPASIRHWGRAHDDGGTVGNFSDELREVHSRREGGERWNLPFEDLLR